MGIVNSGLEKGYERQKKSLIEQIQGAGMSLIDCIEYGNDEDKTGRVISSTLKSITGGKLAPDYWQVFVMNYQGDKRVYVQPYSGSAVLPGEHHFIVDQVIEGPLSVVDIALFGGPEFESSNVGFAKKVNQEEKELRKALKKIVFDWTIGTGRITLDWTFQVYNLSGKQCKIEMRAGRYGGLVTYEVGFDVFNKIFESLRPLLVDQGALKQIPMNTATYSEMADSFLLQESTGDENPEGNRREIEEAAPARSQFKNFEMILNKAFQPIVSKTIFLGEIPGKREANFRKFVMKPEYENQRLVAAIDYTLFGSGKAGVVFTASHVFAKEDDVHVAFALSDVVSLRSLKKDKDDFIEIILSEGSVRVPLSVYDNELIGVFQALIEA